MAERNKMFLCDMLSHIHIWVTGLQGAIWTTSARGRYLREGGGREGMGGGGVGKKKPVIYKSLAIYETKYSRIDQVKYVEYSL